MHSSPEEHGAARVAGNAVPVVSVIVPARNEETCLAACLESLVAQQGIDCEIIVVNDHSTDRTRAVAESFASVRVLDAGALPPRWCGKSNAAWAGARHAAGRWLLFTDADTIHLRGSLAGSVGEAEEHGVALLSYSPAQELHGFLQRAVMPVIFAELAITYRPAKICDPKSPLAAANGQYLLISREAYDAIGGHAAVAESLLEDVELARAVKRNGGKLRFRFGGDAVRTRMYRSFAQLREGWTKNLALLFPWSITLALLRIVEFIAIISGLATVGLALIRGRDQVAALVAIAVSVICANLVRRVRKAHSGWGSILLAIFGLPIFSYLLLRSRLYYRWRSTVTWKGRQYATRTKAVAGGHTSGENARPATGERWST